MVLAVAFLIIAIIVALIFIPKLKSNRIEKPLSYSPFYYSLELL